jgi:hypothetical protein
MHRLCTSPVHILLQVRPIPFLWQLWFLSIAIIITLSSEENTAMFDRCCNLASRFLHACQTVAGQKVTGLQLEALEINVYTHTHTHTHTHTSISSNIITSDYGKKRERESVCAFACMHTHTQPFTSVCSSL